MEARCRPRRGAATSGRSARVREDEDGRDVRRKEKEIKGITDILAFLSTMRSCFAKRVIKTALAPPVEPCGAEAKKKPSLMKCNLVKRVLFFKYAFKETFK